MLKSANNRITTSIRDGRTVYSVSAWPGWQDVFNTILVFAIITFVFVFLVSVFYQFDKAFQDLSDEFITNKWLNIFAGFLLAAFFNVSFVAVIGLVLLIIPLYMIYQLSSKEVWLEDKTLCMRIKLLGIIPRTRRMHFDRILQLEVKKSGSLYNLNIRYEMKLPTLIFVILVFWNERFTQWRWVLINAIPTEHEALNLQSILLEEMTKQL